MSDAVPRRIARAGITPRVQSVYRSVVNVTTADGLLTVAAPDEGGLPNGIGADLGPDWRLIGMQPGMLVHAVDTRIAVPDAGLLIELAEAPRWSPRFQLPDEGADAAAARWQRRTVRARALARVKASRGGFGPLLHDDAARDDSAWVAVVARPILAELTGVLESGGGSAAAAVAARLIGLGPGLTPSGDDVLVGIEAALHALASPSAGFLAEAVNDVDDRTTALAATLLRHAAVGESAERLHRLIAALLGPDDEAIPAAIERAAAWGSTSGIDCLLGVLVGLDVAAGVRAASS